MALLYAINPKCDIDSNYVPSTYQYMNHSFNHRNSLLKSILKYPYE